MRFRGNQSIISIKMIIFGSLLITFEMSFNKRNDYFQVFWTTFKLIGVYWDSWDSKKFGPRLKLNHTTRLIKRVKIIDIHGISMIQQIFLTPKAKLRSNLFQKDLLQPNKILCDREAKNSCPSTHLLFLESRNRF